MIQSGARPIHLDTSFLIRALDPTSRESERLGAWLRDRKSLAVSALAWGEFLCGPLDEVAEALARQVVQRHVPVDVPEAEEAARLFNLAGRRRGSFSDCVIAATALVAGAELATSNRADFLPFSHAGLVLAE